MMKNMHKKIALAIGVACVSNVSLAKDITVWAWDQNFNVPIMQEAAKIYQKANPDVNIEVIDFAKSDIEQKLQTMLASGVTSSLPDIVLIEDYNAPKYLNSYPGAFASMSGKVNYDSFAPYKIDLMTVNGETYGLPFDSGVTGLFYRKDLLAKAGYQPEDMENITWDQLIEIGKVVKEKTGVSMLANDPSDLGLLRIMMQSAGSWYFDQNGEISIKDNKVLAESVKVFADLYKTGITRSTSGWSEWVGAMNTGKAAAVVTGAWFTPSITAEASQAGQWRIAPVPRLDIEGSVNASNLGGSSWYVINSSENKNEAIEFLAETFGSDSSLYNTILKERGAVGTYLPASGTPSYQTEIPYFGNEKIYADFSNWSAQIPAINYGMYTYEADSAVSSIIPSVIQGASIDKALSDVEKQIKYQIQ